MAKLTNTDRFIVMGTAALFLYALFGNKPPDDDEGGTPAIMPGETDPTGGNVDEKPIPGKEVPTKEIPVKGSTKGTLIKETMYEEFYN